MLVHVFNAGVRALAVSIILGGVLIYAVGGLDSPDGHSLAPVIVAGFFIFWIVFVFLFGPRVPKQGEHRPLSEAEGSSTLWARGSHRRDDNESNHHEGGTGDGHGHSGND